ncbi:MAG: hypothetical protein R3C40_03225 [Parvularculaceae bacterium]
MNIKANLELLLPATFLKLGQAGFGGYAEHHYLGDAKAAFAEVEDAATCKRNSTPPPRGGCCDVRPCRPSRLSTGNGRRLCAGGGNFAAMVRRTEGVDISLDEPLKPSAAPT